MLGKLQILVVRAWLWFKTEVAAGRAEPVLWGLSFGESFLFAIPIDAFLAAMVLADRTRWIYLATVTTITSSLGAAVGYLIGFFAFDLIGTWFLHVTNTSAFIGKVTELFADHALLLTFAAAFTPVPNGPIVVAAGFIGTDFLLFMVAWTVGRALRFFAVAYIVYAFGAASLGKSERYLNIGTVVFVLLVVGWFVYRAAGI
ncbi:MAG: VTT domain-containing protein [Patescibacteria group bacterium]